MIPSRQIQVVQNLEGGILSEILVNVGQVVEKDQLLLKIDDTRFSAPYQESRYRYLALKAKVARLKAETEGTNFVPPKEVGDENPEIAERERDLFETRRKSFETGIAILEEQAQQRQQELAELEARQKLWRWRLLGARGMVLGETARAGWTARRATAPTEEVA